MHLANNHEVRNKLLAEILPSVEAAKDNIVENLEYETVKEFDYLYHCYNESLRIEPPAAFGN